MRVELLSIRESRYRVFDESAGHVMSDLGLQFRLRGERLAEVARYGRPILTEAVDSTGRSLLTAGGLGPAEREFTARQQAPLERLEFGGLVLDARLELPARGAAALRRLRGSVRVIYARDYVSVYIDNPRQYQGRTIEHPLLAAHGLEIRILREGDPARAGAPSPRDVALRFVRGAERIHDVTFYDAWLKQLRSRGLPTTSDDGEPCVAYKTEAELTDEHTMVVEFYPHVEDVSIPIELDDVELP